MIKHLYSLIADFFLSFHSALVAGVQEFRCSSGPDLLTNLCITVQRRECCWSEECKRDKFCF
jgi:hypothetical protein